MLIHNHIDVKERGEVKENQLPRDIQKKYEKQNDSYDNNDEFRLDRGKNLANDLKYLLKESSFNDFSIMCGKDGKKVKGCKAILASRCNIFNSIILTDTENKNEVTFSDIESEAMKIVLEFLYTGSVEEFVFSTTAAEATTNNSGDGSSNSSSNYINVSEEFDIPKIIETYYAAFYLEIYSLEKIIIEYVKMRMNSAAIDKNLAPKILTGLIKKILGKEQKRTTKNGNVRNEVKRMGMKGVKSDILDFLVEYISKIPIDSIDLDSISFDALEFLLVHTFDGCYKKYFGTKEADLISFVLLKITKTILSDNINLNNDNNDNDEFANLSKIRKFNPKDLSFFKNKKFLNLVKTDKFRSRFNKFEPFLNVQKVEKSDMIILIQPLDLFSESRIREYYQELAFEKGDDIAETRGIPYIRWKTDLTEFIEYSESNCDISDGSEFSIESIPGFVTTKCITTNLSMSGSIIYRWEFKIEKLGDNGNHNNYNRIWIGICDQKCKESCIETNEDKSGNSWSLCTDARIYKDRVKSYHFTESDESLSRNFFWNIIPAHFYGISEGTKIVMIVDMIKRTLKYEFDEYGCSLDGRWGSELPAKLYPFLAFESSGSRVVVRQYVD